MDAKHKEQKTLSITKEKQKNNIDKKDCANAYSKNKKRFTYYLREFKVSDKEAWSLLNSLSIVIDRYTKLIKLIEDGVTRETIPCMVHSKTGIANLKTEKKYLSDFNFLYNEINKKYLDAYNKKKYFIFKEGLNEKEKGEHTFGEEFLEISLMLSNSLINSLLVALEYINDNYMSCKFNLSDEMSMKYYEYHLKLYRRFKEYGNCNKLTIYDCLGEK